MKQQINTYGAGNLSQHACFTAVFTRFAGDEPQRCCQRAGIFVDIPGRHRPPRSMHNVKRKMQPMTTSASLPECRQKLQDRQLVTLTFPATARARTQMRRCSTTQHQGQGRSLPGWPEMRAGFCASDRDVMPETAVYPDHQQNAQTVKGLHALQRKATA